VTVAAALTALSAGSVPALANDPATVGAAEAAGVLDAAEQALATQAGGQPDREATSALSELADVLPALDRVDKRRARALLARPTDDPDPQAPDGQGYSVPEEPPFCTAHFCVHYVASTEDSPSTTDDLPPIGIPDFVHQIADIAEESFLVEVTELAWNPPRSDGTLGGDSRADIYLRELGQFGLFGYEIPDAAANNQGRSRYGYLVIDDDYDPDVFPGFAGPLDAARVTVAHELNHLLQERYDAVQDLWMFESTAVWMEEQVYPEIDDYLRYVPAFARAPGAPITNFGAARGRKVYGSAVWDHWLQRGAGYGPDVVRRAWEVSDLTDPPDFAVAAYDRAISGFGGRGFSREYLRFAAATAEWRAGGAGFPDAAEYPDMRRKGVLRPGRTRPKRFKLHHTAYRLFRVSGTRAAKIRLKVRAQRGVRSGLALVARTGEEVGGRVVTRSEFLRRGGAGSVSLRRPRRFERITAVIVNADGRQRGFEFDDWDYTRDNRHFSARVQKRR
jgi:hypothetical protein